MRGPVTDPIRQNAVGGAAASEAGCRPVKGTARRGPPTAGDLSGRDPSPKRCGSRVARGRLVPKFVEGMGPPRLEATLPLPSSI